MSERIVNQYRRLVEIRLLHHYWLDEGARVFDLIPQQTVREARLLTYDMRTFLALTPTQATQRTLQGLGCVYKTTALGCVVATPAGAVIPPDVQLDFVLTVLNPAFHNYTALTLRSQKIYELYSQPEDRIYRYKENVPVLSNLSGASRMVGVEKALFLSTEIPGSTVTDQVEFLVRSGNGLSQLTGDQPGAGIQQLAAQADNVPVFLHQGDVPELVPPPGLIGVPARGIRLTGDLPDNLFALIRLSAVRPDDGDFTLIDGAGLAKTPNPVFQVRFKNRSTIWSYFDKQTRAPVSTEANPLPLTYFGNAGTKEKPSDGLVKAVKIGNRITSLVSEIFG
jgi:hypothetical protein